MGPMVLPETEHLIHLLHKQYVGTCLVPGAICGDTILGSGRESLHSDVIYQVANDDMYPTLLSAGYMLVGKWQGQR